MSAPIPLRTGILGAHMPEWIHCDVEWTLRVQVYLRVLGERPRNLPIELSGDVRRHLSEQWYDLAIAGRVRCNCFECNDAPWMGANNPTLSRMSLCSECGNKRCPKATHHDNACTRSNDDGQAGSRYR